MPSPIPMTPDQVRALASAVKHAIDLHLATVETRSGENDPDVQRAYDALAAVAEEYDDALFSCYEEVTPFGPVEGFVEEHDDEDDDDDDEDEDDDDDDEWDDDEVDVIEVIDIADEDR